MFWFKIQKTRSKIRNRSTNIFEMILLRLLHHRHHHQKQQEQRSWITNHGPVVDPLRKFVFRRVPSQIQRSARVQRSFKKYQYNPTNYTQKNYTINWINTNDTQKPTRKQLTAQAKRKTPRFFSKPHRCSLASAPLPQWNQAHTARRGR